MSVPLLETGVVCNCIAVDWDVSESVDVKSPVVKEDTDVVKEISVRLNEALPDFVIERVTVATVAVSATSGLVSVENTRVASVVKSLVSCVSETFSADPFVAS